MRKEIWKEIPETGGAYFASNFGDIKSIDQRVRGRHAGITQLRKGQILKQVLHHSGYFIIGFRKKSTRVHRFVAKAFLPNPNNYPCVNHINGNKLDNRPENLEWCTVRHNNSHARINGLSRSAPGEKNGMAILKDFDIYVIRRLVNSGTMQSVIADAYKLSRACICNIVKRKTWKHIA